MYCQKTAVRPSSDCHEPVAEEVRCLDPLPLDREPHVPHRIVPNVSDVPLGSLAFALGLERQERNAALGRLLPARESILAGLGYQDAALIVSVVFVLLRFRFKRTARLGLCNIGHGCLAGSCLTALRPLGLRVEAGMHQASTVILLMIATNFLGM